jgi:hypothetical protein
MDLELEMEKMAALAFLAAEINRDMSRAARDQRSETNVPHAISFWAFALPNGSRISGDNQFIRFADSLDSTHSPTRGST